MPPVSHTVTMGGIVPLDSCRAMALANNKQLMISRQQVRKAGYQNRPATMPDC